MAERILCVDDEPNVLAAFQRGLRQDFEVEIAESAELALNAIASHGGFAVVVSDLQMPGMNGIQFLGRVRVVAPDSVRIMLTGCADLQIAIDAVNEGNVFRFLTKPCAVEALCKAIAAGVDQYHLLRAEKELLGKTLRGSIRVLIDVLSLVNPIAFGRASRVQRLVRQLAGVMNLEPSWELDIAAMLSQIGCVTLPPETLEKVYRGGRLTPDEAEMYAAHPTVGHDLVVNIPRLEGVAEIIAQQDQPYDRGGAPSNGKSAGEVPLAARMLKVALDYDNLKSWGLTPVEAATHLRARRGLYDPAVMGALESVAATDQHLDVREVALDELTDGMVLADDVLTARGTLVVGRGQETTSHLRTRLRNFARQAGVRGPFRVIVRRRPVAPNALAPAETRAK